MDMADALERPVGLAGAALALWEEPSG